MPSITSVGIVAKSHLQAATPSLVDVERWLADHRVEAVFETATAALMPPNAKRRVADKPSLVSSVGLVLVLGGDGTLLNMADGINRVQPCGGRTHRAAERRRARADADRAAHTDEPSDCDPCVLERARQADRRRARRSVRHVRRPDRRRTARRERDQRLPRPRADASDSPRDPELL